MKSIMRRSILAVLARQQCTRPTRSRPLKRHFAIKPQTLTPSPQSPPPPPKPTNTNKLNPLKDPRTYRFASIITTLSITITIITYFYTSTPPTAHAEAPSSVPIRKIRLSEVQSHSRSSSTRWIIKGTRVYDITTWIPSHPGGEVILRAVGGVIDPYWDIFTIHKKPDVEQILEQYYIGDLDPRDLVDGKVPSDDVQDPFITDPDRDGRLMVLSSRPMNAETPLEGLQDFITPSKLHYVRNHLWVPDTRTGKDEEEYQITIELPDGEEKLYSLKDLKNKFRPVTIASTLQCSGNRRKHMSEQSRSTNGLPWGIGAISTSLFTGCLLRDVLADAGFDLSSSPSSSDILHAQFQGAEAYGASIPVEKATSLYGDVLLAYSMNSAPLPRDHGYPLRVLVPGHVAARSVKWLKRITLSEIESQSQWQQRDYKCFGPNQGGKDVDWDSAPAIQELPTQSVITMLRDISPNSTRDNKLLQVYGLEEDAVEVEGYAYAGGGRRIVRVDISADDGQSWNQADLLPVPEEVVGKCTGTRGKAWAWTRWRYVLPKRLAGRQFVVKAVDEGNNVQPESYEPNWNFRGNLTSAWHRVPYVRSSG